MYTFASSLHQLAMRTLLVCSALLLGACGSGGGGGSDSSASGQPALQGKAVKGVISNGIVTAYRWNATTQSRTKLTSSRTNLQGAYNLPLVDGSANDLILLELTTDTLTRMRCDLPEGCTSPGGGASAAFGVDMPLPSSFKLLAATTARQLKSLNLTPFSHIQVTTAERMPGGLTAENLVIASEWIAQIFELSADEISDYGALDLTALNDGLSDERDLLLSILAAGFYEQTLHADWSEQNTHLDNLSIPDILLQASLIADGLYQQQTGTSELGASLSSIHALTAEQYDNLATQPLEINEHPHSLSVNEGESILLRVQASSSDPIQYQWYKDDIAIPGATSASYAVAEAQLSDAGLYKVSLSDGLINLESQLALVSVSEQMDPVSILQQPLSQTLTEGDALTLSVIAEGDGPMEYQWQKNGSLLPGATSSTLFIASTSLSDTGSYRAVVSNAISTQNSDFATVNITAGVAPVVITQQPQDLTRSEGGNASFSVEVTGGGFIRYQWQKNGEILENETGATLSISGITEADAGSYRVVVSNSRGSVMSNSATLSVLGSEVPVTLSVHPVSASVYAGDSVTLSVVASGGILSYQWMLNGQDIVGANSSSYAISSVTTDDQGLYKVRVSNSGDSVESNAALLSVSPLPSLALSWDIPTQREDGSALELFEINGYRIEYGEQANALDGVMVINDATTTEATIGDLSPDSVLYLRIATVDSDNQTGRFSDTISVAIP